MLIRRFMSLLCGLLIINTFLPAVSRAESDCSDDSDLPVYSSQLSLGSNTYVAYIKLNKKDQRANAAVAIADESLNTCSRIGFVAATDTAWTRVGTVQVSEQGQLQTLYALLSDAKAAQDASAPSILLVPADPAICQDVNNCTVPYKSTVYTQLPQKISFNADTLRVALMAPVNNQTTISKVIFYSDDKVLYTSAGNGSLQFDKRRVSSGDHTLRTNILMSNGQVLSTSEQVDIPFTIGSFTWPFILSNTSTLSTLGVALGVYIVYLLLLSLVRKFVSRRKWRAAHIAQLSVVTIDNSLTPQQRYDMAQKLEAKHKDTKLLGVLVSVPLVLIAALFVVVTYIIGTFTVDGVSMETTLRNRSTQWVYKLPNVVASLNNSTAQVRRGDVVVLHHDDNNLFDGSSEVQKSYVVKRILGLPGERIKVSDGDITVYSTDHPKGFKPDEGAQWQSVVLPSDGRQIDITLREGELFVVGDNRVDSIDSRYYGPVRSSDIVGRVLYKHQSTARPYNSSLSN